jgi:hypothetical protein
VVTRFDEPYALQSPALQNQVFYAARDVALAARAGPMGPCDYAITSRPVMATDKGAALVSALSARAPMREIAEARPFVLLHVK